MKTKYLSLFFAALTLSGPKSFGQTVQYAFTNFAGMAGGPGSEDGTGSVARFMHPNAVAVDGANNVYVADSWNSTIRKITPSGVVTTLAGSAGQIGSDDGTGSAARFEFPKGVAVDGAGNVYVADTGNDTIRKITPAGEVTTLAGLALQFDDDGNIVAGGSGSADGAGSVARFYYPSGVVVDSTGNVYVADTYNGTIRKITPAGEVTTLAGSAEQSGSADGIRSAARFGVFHDCCGLSSGPSAVAVDSVGNVYVADTFNDTIRKITLAGEVTTLAGLAPQFDNDGNVVAGGSGSADGTGSAARFAGPRGVAVDGAGNVYAADTYNHTIRKITPAGEVATLAGSAEQFGSDDGTGSAARFAGPRGVVVDNAGNIFVADSSNDTIRKTTPTGAVTTLAGSAMHQGSDDGTGSAARFDYPAGVAVDSSGNAYVADTFNTTIRKITPAGEVTTLAGSAGQSGSTDGTGSVARFKSPTRVAVDIAGNVYVADDGNYTIRKIASSGAVTTMAGNAGQSGSADGAGSVARFKSPSGVAVDIAGNVSVTDNNTIRKITPTGEVTTLAGSGETGSDDGTGSEARFRYPDAVAVDSAGNVYVADSGNYTIRKITPAGVVTTLAGAAGQIGGADLIGSVARFAYPGGVAVDSAGNLYVADTNNHRITKGTPLFRFQISAGSLTISNGSFQMMLTGPFGSNAVLESSANLQAWTSIQTNTLPPDGLVVSLPLATNQNQFFRARLAP